MVADRSIDPLCTGTPFCGDECRYPEGLFARLQEACAAGLKPVIVSSPAQLSRLPEHLPWSETPRPTRVFSSGAPLALEHAQHTERLLQAPVIEIYGSTECGIAQRRQMQVAVLAGLASRGGASIFYVRLLALAVAIPGNTTALVAPARPGGADKRRL